MSFTTSLGFLALVASPAAAFWRLPCKSPIVVERADPIVSPGAVSGHVHTIMGGNGFDFTMDYNSTQASTCSSCTVIGDNSNYWVPALYYAAEDGTFESVDQVGGATVYYLQRDGGAGTGLKAFPEGFRMISGDPFKRSGGTDFASQAISYNCLDYSGAAKPETGGFPNYNCPDGLRQQVFFPSCWDGVNLDMPDHKSHMAFPIGAYNDGLCPDTHPVHLISIFFEIIWDTNKFASQWYGDSQPFVFAMGDPTGYGSHGDFVMGWEEQHLQDAVDQCTNLSGRVEDCPVFDLIPDSQAEGCMIEPKVNEVVSGTLAALPGCNPVRAGPGEVSPVPTNCSPSNATISNTTASFFKDLTGSGWSYQGCGTDNYYSRILTGASTSDSNMTNENCVAFCGAKGFSVAGSEYADECYCGDSIPDSGAPLPGVPGNCKMPCAGDASEMCGGTGTIGLYVKCKDASNCVNADVGQGSGVSPTLPTSAVGGAAASSGMPAASATGSAVWSASASVLGSVSSVAAYGQSGSSPSSAVVAGESSVAEAGGFYGSSAVAGSWPAASSAASEVAPAGATCGGVKVVTSMVVIQSTITVTASPIASSSVWSEVAPTDASSSSVYGGSSSVAPYPTGASNGTSSYSTGAVWPSGAAVSGWKRL